MDSVDFITDGTIERITRQRNHRLEVMQEGFTRKLEHCQDDAEALCDYGRDLVKAGGKPVEQLQAAETFVRALLLAILLLQREANQ